MGNRGWGRNGVSDIGARKFKPLNPVSTPHSPLPTPHSPFPIPHSPFIYPRNAATS
ncbi:MAG: hypothetical protein DSM106950_14110 [Stigonema ocellatum SAG 48.90 = DSM 106950]|nr:hypothetical protein [Stigonema ocellatum SAG 48.90 = DSM 106950]